MKMQKLVNDYIPLVKIGGKKFDLPLDKEILTIIREKNKLSRKFVKTKDEQVRKIYNRTRNKAVKFIRKARKTHENKLAQDAKNNPKRIWNYINLKSKVKQGIGELHVDNQDPKSRKTNDDTEKANILAEFFSTVFTIEGDGDIPNIQMNETNHPWTKPQILEERIEKLLKELKADKSPGLDNIHPKFLKELHHELACPDNIQKINTRK